MIISGTVAGQPPFTISTGQLPSGMGGLGFDFGAFLQSITVPAFDLVKTIVAPPTQVIRNADGSTVTVRTPQTVQTGSGPTTAQSVGQAASNIALGGISTQTLLIGGGILLGAIMLMNQGRR